MLPSMSGAPPMSTPRSILIVSPTLTLASSLQLWLNEAGYTLTVVDTFPAAKSLLRALPDVLITEVRLADYNGLHLALYAREQGIPTVVVGDDDPVVEAQAAEFGATFIRRGNVSRDEVLSQADSLISAAPPRRRAANTDVQGFGVASDVEWSVAPGVMRDRGTTPFRRLTQH